MSAPTSKRPLWLLVAAGVALFLAVVVVAAIAISAALRGARSGARRAMGELRGGMQRVLVGGAAPDSGSAPAPDLSVAARVKRLMPISGVKLVTGDASRVAPMTVFRQARALARSVDRRATFAGAVYTKLTDGSMNVAADAGAALRFVYGDRERAGSRGTLFVSLTNGLFTVYAQGGRSARALPRPTCTAAHLWRQLGPLPKGTKGRLRCRYHSDRRRTFWELTLPSPHRQVLFDHQTCRVAPRF